MEEIILSLALGKEVTEEQIKYALYEICDREHSSCNCNCPVYALNGNKVPDSCNDFDVNRGCDCFKSGNAMLNFIRNNASA